MHFNSIRLGQTLLTISLALFGIIATPNSFGQMVGTQSRIDPAPVAAASKYISPANAAAKSNDSWPTRPIRLLVGFPPGSVQDLSARVIAEPLSRELGQPVIVENKAGASGTIAATQVARATDEHTLGVMNNSQLTIAKRLNPLIGYDPEQDLAPIALIGSAPLMLVVSKDATGNTPIEWLQWLRNQRDHGNYGSPGAGTPGHLVTEFLKTRIGFEAMHVPYPGNPQVITALLAGQLQAALMQATLIMPHIKSGKLNAIGVTSLERSPMAPTTPTLNELGVFGADFDLWTALAGPASLPAPIQQKLEATILRVLKTEEVRSQLLNAGWQPSPSNASGLKSRIRRDTATFGEIIITRNIKAEN